jgi:chromate reductase, NAD(P)H dehydrogenase (quinone)
LSEKFKIIQILAISGSLRSVSSNKALLGAAIALAPKGCAIVMYEGLGDLPHFNPDIEASNPPPVMDFRTQLQRADGVIISSPEYAHGVPGVLKNALDWVVGTGEFVRKPVALLNASPRATHAQESLTEIISTMDGLIIPAASVTLPLLGKGLDETGIIADVNISRLLQSALVAFVEAIECCSS